MVRAVLLCLALLAMPARADTTIASTSVQDFRAMIHRGDRAAVVAALKAAIAADLVPGGVHGQTRALFRVFQDLHPLVDSFTKSWADNDPDSPLAETARGWQLIHQGWVWRGAAVAPWPDSMAHMQALHAQAMPLMRKAFAADPGLLPASDGVLDLIQTIGWSAQIPQVLEQVMRVHPNRKSLMMAMLKLAPQWGGNQAQVDLLCDRYAPMVENAPGYDPATCRIDAAYYAEYWDGPRFQAARAALPGNTSPVLDYARLTEVLRGIGTAQSRRAFLDKLHKERDFLPDEAMAYDELTAILKNDGSLIDLVEFRKAVHAKMLERRVAIDNVPLDPAVLSNYRDVLLDDMDQLAAANQPVPPYPAADMQARMRAILMAFPNDPATWLHIGDDIAGFGLPGDGAADTDVLTNLATAEPYIDNAIAFSLGNRAILEQAVKGKLLYLSNTNTGAPPPDYNDLAPDQAARLDAVVNCPLLRQVALLNAACQADGFPWDQCGPSQLRDEYIFNRVANRIKAGACTDVTHAPSPAALMYTPVAVDLTSAN